MASIEQNQPLLPSVLDRLIDAEPQNSRDGFKSHGQVLRELKAAVRRDLEHLLNTRWRCTSWPPNLDELNVSLLNYGIPDFTSANLGAAVNREEFRRIIETVVKRFEPRFKTVRVHLIRNEEATDRTMRFRIDAMLHAEPMPEPVTFDSMLQPATGTFQVQTNAR